MKVSCYLHGAAVAAAALALSFTFNSCTDDNSAVFGEPASEPDHGTLTGVTWSGAYSIDEFEKEFSTIAGGKNLAAVGDSLGIDIAPLAAKTADLLLKNQDRILQHKFNVEQGRYGARWNMEVYSITFSSIGYKGEPIELSAIVAFPNAIDGTKFHQLDGISVYNHARIDLSVNEPSRIGDIMLLRAFYNQLVVIPDEEGLGASIDHYFAQTENDRNARQTIDAIRAALELINGMGVEMKEGYGTQNFGISLGGETCVGFHHYMETKATPEERQLVNLKATFGGSGVITPSMYFQRADNGTAEAPMLNLGLALNQLEGLLELPASALGGYDPRTRLFSPELFEMVSQDSVTPLMEARRLLQSADYSQLPFQTMFQKDMLDSVGKFNYDSPKTQALFEYLKQCDLGYGWTPEAKFTLVWGDEDKSMQPYMHQQAYRNLRRLPNGGTNPNVKKYEVSMPLLRDNNSPLTHFALCAYYFIKCIEHENPEELGTY